MKDIDLKSYIIEQRRKFHRIPEIAYNEFQTQAEIIKELEDIGIQYRRVGTGIIAEIKSGKQNTMAFRSDIDALPITETGDCPYKSENVGFMHACGHDGHIALLLAFIRYCKNNPDKMANNAVFIFQPAEESEGGAITMIENGAIDEVDEIYAVHVDPSLPQGQAGLRAGVSMAGAYEFDITAEGESCHCAEKQLGKDALHATTSVINGIYSNLNKNAKSIFHCGKISGGYARNIVADKVTANCTIRYFEEEDLNDILGNVAAQTEKAEKEFGVKFGIKLLTNYIPLVNDFSCCEKVKKYIQWQQLPLRFTAEDFAFYLKEVKGCLIWLGTGGDAPKKLHSPDFDFEEKALFYGLNLYKELIKEKVNG